MALSWNRAGGVARDVRFRSCNEAATCVAAKAARVPYGQRQHVFTACPPAPSGGETARRSPLRVTVDRDLRMALARPCRYSLPLAFCAENAAPAPPAVRNIFNTTLLQNDEGRSIASRSLQSRRVLPIVQTSFQTAEWPCIIASFACTISARAIRPPM